MSDSAATSVGARQAGELTCLMCGGLRRRLAQLRGWELGSLGGSGVSSPNRTCSCVSVNRIPCACIVATKIVLHFSHLTVSRLDQRLAYYSDIGRSFQIRISDMRSLLLELLVFRVTI